MIKENNVFCFNTKYTIRVKKSENDMAVRIFNPINDVVYDFSDTAAVILSLIDGSNTVGEIVNVLLSDYAADKNLIINDLLQFLEELISKKIIYLK